MSGYRAQIAELRQSAGVARSAREQASEAGLVAAFEGADRAIPGSRSERILHQAANALDDDVVGWVAKADAYAADLEAAADRYSVNEDAAASGFSAQAGD